MKVHIRRASIRLVNGDLAPNRVGSPSILDAGLLDDP
jgi:hypothetical protein